MAHRTEFDDIGSRIGSQYRLLAACTKIDREDEGALFGIANEFSIGHRRRGQQGDYDRPLWTGSVWWYLATVELTDRLVARQGTEQAPDVIRQIPLSAIPVGSPVHSPNNRDCASRTSMPTETGGVSVRTC